MKKGDVNYELEFLKAENEKLKHELVSKKSKFNERDVTNLLRIAMRMRDLLEVCRAQTLPFDLGRQIDAVMKEIDNYE
jgi:hypothetical protein